MLIMLMNKNENLAAFEARLEKKGLVPGANAYCKYVAEYKNLLFYRQHQEAQLSMHAGHIQLAELHDENGWRVLNTYRLMSVLTNSKKIHFVVYPKIDSKLNLVANRTMRRYGSGLPPTEVPDWRESFHPIGKISVWQEPERDDNNVEHPVLTLEQIIAQIPQGLVGNTKAVCILSEEKNLFEDAYNMYMDCYQFKDIWLLG